MSQIAHVVELKRIRPVKWSAIDRSVEQFRKGYVKAFLKYEGRSLLNEDGSVVINAKGTPVELNATRFAQRYGIPPRTFREWVIEVRGITHPEQQRYRADTARHSEEEIEGFGEEIAEDHGRCSHCPRFPEGR